MADARQQTARIEVATTRIHDLAAEFGISSEQLMGMLKEMDIFVRSHLTPLKDEQVSLMRARWERDKRKQKQPATPPKRRRAAAQAAEPAPEPVAAGDNRPKRRRRTAAEVAAAVAAAAPAFHPDAGASPARRPWHTVGQRPWRSQRSAAAARGVRRAGRAAAR